MVSMSSSDERFSSQQREETCEASIQPPMPRRQPRVPLQTLIFPRTVASQHRPFCRCTHAQTMKTREIVITVATKNNLKRGSLLLAGTPKR